MTTKKRGLGRGLASLISDDLNAEANNKNSVINIDLKLIAPNKKQPRKEFDHAGIEDLANSIKMHGIIQPIIVRKAGKKYEIIAGERRWRASKLAGLEEIPSIIKSADDELSAKYALIENVQREDLNPVEEGRAYRELMDEFGLTQEELAREVGKSRSYIANSVRILNLSQEVLDYVYIGKLSLGHGKVLLGIKDKKDQLLIANRVISDNLNIRQTEEIIKNDSEMNKHKKNYLKPNKDPQVIQVEESLMRILGTKVNLKLGKKKGKIEIEYYGFEDLERIIELLKNE